MENGTMLQGFQWELPADGRLWRQLAFRAIALRRLGFTAVWLPPAFKGAGGASDVGYGVYDLYDLGEFHQKGSTRTKYGSKLEYLLAIRALKIARIQPLADIVLNHRMGADECEDTIASRVEWEDRRTVAEADVPVRLFTLFTFPGRKGRYSRFVWNKDCFTGTDWDEQAGRSGIFLIKGKHWAEDVDGEKGNYDYLMGADVDFSSAKVRAELRRWGRWFVDTTRIGGFRLDAVKHISADFYREWLMHVRAYTGKELYAVGEYWNHSLPALHRYLEQTQGVMNLFDVPLHAHFREASASNGEYDMSKLFDDTLVGSRPHQAVTFVDNHDTQPGQALESWVNGWFKAAAYGLILLRAYGYPCVFWGDLEGIPSRGIGPVTELPLLLRLRKTHAHGPEHDYLDHPSVIGFTREGDKQHPGSGLAFLCTNREAGVKRMLAGKQHAGKWFRCVLGGQERVLIDKDGWGEFAVVEGGCSVYVPENQGLSIMKPHKKRK